MDHKPSFLNVKYACIQGFYWMEYGVVFSFASVYLLDRGFTSSQVGVIMAIANLLAVFFQSPLAAFADKTKKITLTQISMLLTLSIFAFCMIMLVFRNNVYIGIIMLLLNATLLMLIQPLTSAIGMFFINRGYPLNFGLTRGIGSISYAVLTTVMGFMIEGFGTNAIPLGLAFISMLFVTVCILLSTSSKVPNILHETEVTTEVFEPLSLVEFARKYKKFMCMLVGIVFIFSTHSSLNTYLYQIMQAIGGNSKDVGISLSISAIAELPTMFGFFWIIRKFKSNQLLRISMVFFTIKTMLYIIAPTIFFIHGAQTLQMLGYALFTPTVIYYVNQLVNQEDSVKGQALVTTAITAGGIMGSLLSGQLVVSIGTRGMLIVGTVLSLIGTIIVFFSVEDTATNQ